VATLDPAHGIGPQQRHLLRRGHSSTQVRDVGHVDALGDDQLDDRVAQEMAHHSDRQGPEPGDLAQLVAGHPTTDQGFQIDSDEGQVLRIGSLGRGAGRTRSRLGVVLVEWLAGRRRIRCLECSSRQIDQGVEGIRLTGLSRPSPPGSLEPLVHELVPGVVELGALIHRSSTADVPGAFAVCPGASPPVSVDSVPGGLGIRVRLGLLASTLILQILERLLLRLIDQVRLGGGVHRSGIRDGLGLLG